MESNSRINKLYPIFSFLVVCILWEISATVVSDEYVFPRGIAIIESFWELLTDGTLLQHSVASLYRVTIGFYLAILLAIPLGIIMGRVEVIHHFLNPLVQFLRPISPLAWIPLAMMWFGIGDASAIFLIFLPCFFSLVFATYVAVDSISPIHLRVAANFDFDRMEVLTHVIIPAIIPDVVTALRSTSAISWIVVVAAEMIAVQSGLGYLILDSRNALRMDYVLVGMITIGAIGLLLDRIMLQLGQIEIVAWKTL